MCEFYTDMKDVPNNHPDFQRAIKVAPRAFENVADLRDPALHPLKKARVSGGGRKRKALKICSALFSWFVDERKALKGCLPKHLFKLKGKKLYAEWSICNPTEPENQLQFGSPWIKEWEDEYGVSLRKPNKCFSIKKEDLVTRIEVYLQDVWTVRNFFIKKCGIDPPVINGDQMPLYRNENASQKTLAFKGLDTYVKGNYMLSLERATVFTETSSNSSIDLKPEFIFRGKGMRTKLNPPSGIKFQWSESGSY